MLPRACAGSEILGPKTHPPMKRPGQEDSLSVDKLEHQLFGMGGPRSVPLAVGVLRSVVPILSHQYSFPMKNMGRVAKGLGPGLRFA